MKMLLCYTLDGDNVINKSITNIKELEIILRNDFNLNSPEFKLKIDYSELIKCNYIIINDLNLKLFIREFNNLGNNLFIIKCDIDLLETYKEIILNSTFEYNRELKNGDYVNINPEYLLKTESIKFDSVSIEESESIIISTLGG